MNATYKLFLMLDEEHGYGQLIGGSEPCTAVEEHYASLDAWCSPSADAEVNEDFSVFLYEIPTELADHVTEQLEDLSGDDIAARLPQLLQENKVMSAKEINVIYTATEGASASELPVLPDFFNRSREG